MHDVFLSYSSEDRARAKHVAQALEVAGYSVWWDTQIVAGSHFDVSIEGALSKSRAVVVLWSKASVASNWVKEEATEGANRGILIPFLIDDVAIPLGFKRIQAAKLEINWYRIDSSQREILLKSISNLLGQPTAPKVDQFDDSTGVHRTKAIEAPRLAESLASRSEIETNNYLDRSFLPFAKFTLAGATVGAIIVFLVSDQSKAEAWKLGAVFGLVVGMVLFFAWQITAFLFRKMHDGKQASTILGENNLLKRNPSDASKDA